MSAEAAPRPGQLRLARDPEGGRLPSGVHARLVLVVDLPASDVVTCLLVTESVDLAGPCDLVLEPEDTGLDMPLSVHGDLAVSLLARQLGRVLAELPIDVVEVATAAHAAGEVPAGAGDRFARGLPLGTPEDPRWAEKLQELADVHRLDRGVRALVDGGASVTTAGVRDTGRDVVRVVLSLSAAAAPSQARTTDRQLHERVELQSAEGVTATVRVVGGRGPDRRGVDVRLVGALPPGGLWTQDGREVTAAADVRIEAGDDLLETVLRSALVFGP